MDAVQQPRDLSHGYMVSFHIGRSDLGSNPNEIGIGRLNNSEHDLAFRLIYLVLSDAWALGECAIDLANQHSHEVAQRCASIFMDSSTSRGGVLCRALART